ncbi:MAG: hypothetical protein KDA91_15650 [Planctomycetaceae bacterium]|nr:hypothetical protein [Planctomycetaceae bacterium]
MSIQFAFQISLITSAVLSTCHSVDVAHADDSVPMVWHVANRPDGDGSRWYRFTFNANPAGQPCEMKLASAGTVSLHVNGQRIIRQQPMEVVDGQVAPLQLDISSLLRNGRNCIAIEVRTAEKTSALATTIQLESKAVTGEWRVSDAAPPVGWQQTDFNARDWKVDAGSTESGSASFQPGQASKVVVVVTAAAQKRSPFAFRDGDHIVLLGATFFERAQQFGHLESLLTAASPGLNLTFRNLGWDADTVFADSRGIFDSPETGYLRMIEHVRAEEPSVIIICYGQNEALNSRLSVEQFQVQLNRLLDDLKTTSAAIVLMTPHELLPAVRPIPDPSRFNDRILQFANAVQEVASQRALTFVDLFNDFTDQLNAVDGRLSLEHTSVSPDTAQHSDLLAMAASRWSENGMHFNARGYKVASVVARDRLLGISASGCQVQVDAVEQKISVTAGTVRNVVWNGSPNKLVTFELQESVVSPIPLDIQIAGKDLGMGWSGKVHSPSVAAAEVAPQVLIAASDDQLHLRAPVSWQYEQLNLTVARKNELYFHRWRPQNITYLFGFRKHEQGNNAVEIAQFDPFVRELESQIQQLKQPQWRRIEISRQ